MNTKDCLKDFAENPIGKKSAKIDLIVDFVGAQRATVRQWLKGNSYPKGVKKIKLVEFLFVCGYMPDELINLLATGKYVSSGISFDLFTIEQVVEATQYKSTDGLLEFLSGRVGLSSKREKLFEEFIKKEFRLDEYQFRLKLWRSKVASSLPGWDVDATTRRTSTSPGNTIPMSQVSLKAPKPSSGNNQKVAFGKNETIEAMAAMVKAMTPLAEYLNSDACTPDDRSLLREKCGRFGIFNLKNTLTALCGERARLTQKERKEGEAANG